MKVAEMLLIAIISSCVLRVIVVVFFRPKQLKIVIDLDVTQIQVIFWFLQ